MSFDIWSEVSLQYGGQTIEKMIAQGAYDEVDPGITSDNFPFEKGKATKFDVFVRSCTIYEFTPMIKAVGEAMQYGYNRFSPVAHLLILGIELTRNPDSREDLFRCIWPHPDLAILALGSSMSPYLPFVRLEIYNHRTRLELCHWAFPPARWQHDQFLLSK